MVQKIVRGWQAISRLLNNPRLLNLVLEEDGMWKSRLQKATGPIPYLPEINLKELFGDFSQDVNPYLFSSGGSMPTDLALLRMLARKQAKCKYFEIGTWMGESVANVAAEGGICVTVDLPDQEKRSLGLTEEYIDNYARLSKNLAQVKHLQANSQSMDFSMLGGPFDLVFIDGDHHYSSVVHDTRSVFSFLLHPESIVVWHDYFYYPGKVRHETLQAILDGVPDWAKPNLYAVSNTMCAIYLPDKIVPNRNLLQFQMNISLTQG